MNRRRLTLAAPTIFVALALAVLLHLASLRALPAPTVSPGAPTSTVSSGGPNSPVPTQAPTPTASPSGTFSLSDLRAPPAPWPLPELASPPVPQSPPTLTALTSYLYGNKALLSFAQGAPTTDWRVAAPRQAAIAGYADSTSVEPGGSIGLHVAGTSATARADVFRLGLGDAKHVLTIPSIPVAPLRVRQPDPTTGVDEMRWPTAYELDVPSGWRSGLYVVKLTASGGQSYLQFVVRPIEPIRFVVMIPTLTYQAYNSYGGVSLYHWAGRAASSRGYAVSFDRPYGTANGLATFMRADFPLLVWLENHGYAPGYVTDVDVAEHPEYVTGARTVVIAGHAEYWTRSMRAAFLAAERRGVGVVAFGANLAYWQVRLEPSSDGLLDRTVICYKDSLLDPVTSERPQLATTRFDQLPDPEYAHEIFGADYTGIVQQVHPFVVTIALLGFTAETGLEAGQELPGLLGGEVDQLADPAHGFSLMTASVVETGGVPIAPTASVWVSPGGAHVFDAGTFTWAWGLDPRYAAALPGLPADAFARLTSQILAWAGAWPEEPR